MNTASATDSGEERDILALEQETKGLLAEILGEEAAE